MGPSLRDWLEDRRDEAAAWAEGRSPWLRGALAVYLAYAGVRHLSDPLYRSWFGGITLAFHELGHVLFSPLGHTLHLLGGSVVQLLVPAVAAATLLVRQGDWFGFGVGLSWLSFSAFELATYVGDANQERLPLVSLGGRAEHDWSTLLTEWRLLNACGELAIGVRVGAFAAWALAMLLCAWLVYRMARSSRT